MPEKAYRKLLRERVAKDGEFWCASTEDAFLAAFYRLVKLGMGKVDALAFLSSLMDAAAEEFGAYRQRKLKWGN